MQEGTACALNPTQGLVLGRCQASLGLGISRNRDLRFVCPSFFRGVAGLSPAVSSHPNPQDWGPGLRGIRQASLGQKPLLGEDLQNQRSGAWAPPQASAVTPCAHGVGSFRGDGRKSLTRRVPFPPALRGTLSCDWMGS